MIQKSLTAYCDGCAEGLPLFSQTLKDSVGELANKLWTTEGKLHYCSACSLQRVQERAPQSIEE